MKKLIKSIKLAFARARRASKREQDAIQYWDRLLKAKSDERKRLRALNGR